MQKYECNFCCKRSDIYGYICVYSHQIKCSKYDVEENHIAGGSFKIHTLKKQQYIYFYVINFIIESKPCVVSRSDEKQRFHVG